MSPRNVCAALAVLLAAAGCERAGIGEAPASSQHASRSAPVTAPETAVDAVATGEPGLARNRWAAQSDLARTVTGNLTASLEAGRGGPLVMAFANGQTLRMERIAEHVGADRTGSGGATFAATLGADPNAGVFVYRVSDERIYPTAVQGGVCQREAAKYVALSEFVNRNGDWVFVFAAYRGEQAPGPQAERDPQLCGAYGYAVN
ncbi:MAG: hypothetical protein IV086_01850 [Hyphomonadaceae bacterium]|nr:hypothetical protein [Hyphomonadaceae bacterium]